MANIIQQSEEYFLNGILDIIDLGPIEEILYNEYVKIKICQQLLLGWNEIYFDPHFSESQERMVHLFTFPHQINQGLLLMYDLITPHQLKQEILRLFNRYSPQNGNVIDYLKDYLGWRYDRQFLSSDDEESSDDDVDDGPSLRLFRNLHHIFEDKINNGVYKCASAA